MAKIALMCAPSFFEVREVKNPHMVSRVDHARAQQQWNNLLHELERSGVTVETIAPVKNLEDMVFAANQVFVGHHSEIGKFVVPSRMRYQSRQQEVPFYVDWFRRRGYKIIDLSLTAEYLEGHGDLLWHPGSALIWAGYGFRSTRGGVAKFAAAMTELGFEVKPLELVDEHCYHLDTCFNPLNGEAVLIYPGAFSAGSLETIRAGWKRVHELTREEAIQFIANGIVVNGRYITPRLTPNLANILAQEKLTPVMVETSEFEKSGGSAFCMKTFIE